MSPDQTTFLSSQSSGATAPPPPQPPTGRQALLAAAVAIAGVITALFPNAPLVTAVTTALPPLKVALPIVLTSIGSIWAAISHPPTLRKER